MPPYEWLLRKDLAFKTIPAKMRGLQTLGTPYSDADIDGAIETAQNQAAQIARNVSANGGPAGLESKEITALVAYLQRLGADLKKSTS